MKQRIAYLSSQVETELLQYLDQLIIDDKLDSHELIYPHADLDPAISCHPDVYMCRLSDSIYFGNPSLLSGKYPGDVLYNSAAVGKYLICSKFTSTDLIEKSRLTPIIVPQGYVKCNLVIVDDNHLITEDPGIYKVLQAETDLDCLLINSKEVELPGYKHGFIGGCSGKIGNTVIFNGDLSAHSDYKNICNFIEKCNCQIKYFKNYKLHDIGSIITNF